MNPVRTGGRVSGLPDTRKVRPPQGTVVGNAHRPGSVIGRIGIGKVPQKIHRLLLVRR